MRVWTCFSRRLTGFPKGGFLFSESMRIRLNMSGHHPPKVYGHIYIDDAALGAPLVTDVDDKYIDWKMAAAHLYCAGLLSENDITELFGDI